jgi:hypothetical protein
MKYFFPFFKRSLDLIKKFRAEVRQIPWLGPGKTLIRIASLNSKLLVDNSLTKKTFALIQFHSGEVFILHPTFRKAKVSGLFGKEIAFIIKFSDFLDQQICL